MPGPGESGVEEAGTRRGQREEGMHAALVTRRHHVWPGNNRFLCDGRLMMGPGVLSCVVTLAFILAPSLSFFANTSAVLLAHDTQPVWILLAAAQLAVVLFAMARTAVCDPGIIPRRDGYLDERLKKILPKSQGLVINGRVVTLRYCTTCNIYRPPRSSHCKICDNCVDRFDHHCPWVGNCIGRRNYYWFLLFTFSSAAFAVYILAACCRALYLQGLDEADADANLPLLQLLVLGAQADTHSLSVAIFCLLSMLFTVTLSSFHVYLVSKGLTTNEYIKGTYSDRSSVYSRGCCANWASVLTDPVPASLFDANETVGLGGGPDERAGGDIEMGADLDLVGGSHGFVSSRGRGTGGARRSTSRTHDARPQVPSDADPGAAGAREEGSGVLPGIPRVML